jgi:hypothetical protein
MSILQNMLIGTIGATSKIQGILGKQKNRLIFGVLANNATINSNATQEKYTIISKIKNKSAQEKYTINFDIIKSWNYKNSVKITQNPVEQGVLINDHRIIMPMELKIEVGVSNIINPLNSLVQGKNLLQTSTLLLIGNKTVADSPMVVTNSLLDICLRNSETFDIETPLGIFKNFLLINKESTNDNTNYGAFEGILEFQEILIYDKITAQTNLSGVNPRPKVNNQTFQYTS